jgi:hypothetical protein
MSDDSLVFTWEMNMGRKGVDDDPSTPISRALNRLLRTGQPLHKLGLCLTALPEVDGKTNVLRWLGVFAFSDGKRVIFFPGHAQLPDRLISFQGPNQRVNANITVDHISLERDMNEWHATSPQSQQHFGGPKTLPLGDDRFLWFGMSIAGEHALHEVKNQTTVTANVPGTDAARRINVFKESRDAIVFPIVSLPQHTLSVPAPYFFHYSAIVGPVGFPDYCGTEHAFPIGSPFLTFPLPQAIQLPASTYRLSLAPFCDIQVTVMRLHGALTVPIHLTVNYVEERTRPVAPGHGFGKVQVYLRTFPRPCFEEHWHATAYHGRLRFAR